MQIDEMIRNHWQLLGHKDLGVTEFRVFDPVPMVAYADNEDDAVRLCLEMDGKTTGIYVGVQPRPLSLFDKAPNCWRSARSGPDKNCACDNDIEYITSVFFDIDVVSTERTNGHPASDEELARTLHAAQLLCREDGLALCATICCSGNGHYVLVNVVPIAVDGDEAAVKFRNFCRQLVEKVAGRVSGVKFDPVYNLSRVMRMMGTFNRKGQPVPGRSHRPGHFVTEPIFARSLALHHMIPITEVEEFSTSSNKLPKTIRCDIRKLETCEFMQWCRSYPNSVSEPLWFGLITNLAYLEGGPELIHEISALDNCRYDYSNTQRLIQRVIDVGYNPMLCKTLVSEAMSYPDRGRFRCSRISQCPAKAPMYMATLHTAYQR